MRPDLLWALALGVAAGLYFGLFGGSMLAVIEADRVYAIDTVVLETGSAELRAALVTQEVLRGNYVSDQREGLVVERAGRPTVRLLGMGSGGDLGTLTVLDDHTVRWKHPLCDRVDLTVP